MALAAFMGGVGSFQRIQAFMTAPTTIERRKLPDSQSRAGSSSDFGDYGSEKGSDESTKSHSSLDLSRLQTSMHAIIIENGSLSWRENVGEQSHGCLRDLNLTVPRAKITMVVGPVGSGKSTLLKGILGELPVVKGVHLSSVRIAFCEQTPWHMNGTVQQAIIGVSEFEQRWYSAVVRGCALDEDLRQLPKGDQTEVGSKGIALSGGQSQRIVSFSPPSTTVHSHKLIQALARAVYAQKDIVILDDCLSGLDSHTETRVWHSLFGQSGLLRRCRSTVLMSSSSGMYISASVLDHLPLRQRS